MSKGGDFMKEITFTAERMKLGSADKIWTVGFSRIVLGYQHEEDGPTWWVRHCDMAGMPMQSWHCLHLFHVVAAVAAIMDKIGMDI